MRKEKETWHQQFSSPVNTSSPDSSQSKNLYKRTNVTAEEKIQEELKEMQRREEELRYF